MPFFPIFLWKPTLRLQLQYKSNYFILKQDCSWKNWSNLDKWHSLKHELFCIMFEGKTACFITSSEKYLETCDLDGNSIISKRHQNNKMMHIVPKENWTGEDLKKIITSNDIENMEFWMTSNLGVDQALKMTGGDIDAFPETFLIKPHLDLNEEFSKLEFLGNFSNGNCVMWNNLTPHKKNNIVSNLKKLALNLHIPVEEV